MSREKLGQESWMLFMLKDYGGFSKIKLGGVRKLFHPWPGILKMRHFSIYQCFLTGQKVVDGPLLGRVTQLLDMLQTWFWCQTPCFGVWGIIMDHFQIVLKVKNDVQKRSYSMKGDLTMLISMLMSINMVRSPLTRLNLSN